LIVAHAHNDWLELWAETGSVGAILLLSGVLLYLIYGIAAWRQRRDPWSMWLGFGALATVIVLGTHGLGEFLLRTRANALTLAGIMAWGWVALHLRRRPRGETLRWPIGKITVPNWIGRSGMAGLACVHLLVGIGMVRHLVVEFRVPTERNSTIARKEVRELDALRSTIGMEPGNAQRWSFMAREVLRQGPPPGLVAWARSNDLDVLDQNGDAAVWARHLQQKAIRLNPTCPSLYQQMGWILASKPDWRKDGLAEHALRLSVYLEPSNGTRHFHLGHYLLQDGRPQDAEDSFNEAVRLSPRLKKHVKRQ
jgi:hypothetical protein